jgi:PAS domain S-box-containing protein
MKTTHACRAPGTSLSSSVPGEDERRFRSLFDRNPTAVLRLDPRGRIVEANAAVQARFGHEPSGLRGQPLSVLIPDWDEPALLADLAQSHQPHDAALRHAAGQRCEVAVALLPVDADGGAGQGYFLVARDVTAQKRLHRQMQVQAEILARTHDAVVVLDEEAKVVCWNAGATRLYGVTAQAMAGQPFDLLFDAPDRARLHECLAEVSFGAPEPTALQLCGTSENGEKGVLQLCVSRIAGIERGRELWVVQGASPDADRPPRAAGVRP